MKPDFTLIGFVILFTLVVVNFLIALYCIHHQPEDSQGEEIRLLTNFHKSSAFSNGANILFTIFLIYQYSNLKRNYNNMSFNMYRTHLNEDKEPLYEKIPENESIRKRNTKSEHTRNGNSEYRPLSSFS